MNTLGMVGVLSPTSYANCLVKTSARLPMSSFFKVLKGSKINTLRYRYSSGRPEASIYLAETKAVLM